jgi:ABC-type uncharacterized transport system substrate-binding protein
VAVRIDLRGHGGDIDRIRALAQELVGLQPDIIVTGTTPDTVALQRETRTIPVVFANAGDPVARDMEPQCGVGVLCKGPRLGSPVSPCHSWLGKAFWPLPP